MTVQIGSRRLLVSVRSVEEAAAALRGGAEIIDIKEPKHGSLGRATTKVMHEIVAEIVEGSSDELASVEVSAALGEVHEVPLTDDFQLPDGVRYAKLGLSRLRRDDCWSERWCAVRETYEQSHGSEIQWIAVIYADETLAESPPADEVIDAAVETGCVGVLVDTWLKTGGRLLDHVTLSRLADWASRLHREGLFFAVAGRLMVKDLSRLSDVAADVIAVRSAVCEGQDRQAIVKADRVAALRQAIDEMPRCPTSME